MPPAKAPRVDPAVAKANRQAQVAKAREAVEQRKAAGGRPPTKDKVAQEMERLNSIEFSPISFLMAIAEFNVVTIKAYRINPKDVTLKIRKEAAVDVLPYMQRKQPIAPTPSGELAPDSAAEQIARAVREMGLRTGG